MVWEVVKKGFIRERMEEIKKAALTMSTPLICYKLESHFLPELVLIHKTMPTPIMASTTKNVVAKSILLIE